MVKKARLCYMDTNFDRPFLNRKNKKVFESMKNKLGRTIRTQFVGLRAKAYSYLIDDGSEDKKAKGTKKCIIKKP